MIYSGGRRDGLLLVGRLGKPHALKGHIKLSLFNDDPDGLDGLSGFFIEKDGKLQEAEVESVEGMGSSLRIKFRGVDDRNAAEVLQGCSLYAGGAETALEEDEYYIADLVGCTVLDEADRELGTLEEIMQHGAADVYVLKRPDAAGTVMFPALKRLIQSVDIDHKRIVVDAAVLKEVAIYED